jgi:hypothetical protein
VATEELRVAPAALVTLADSMLAIAKRLARAQLEAQAELAVPPSAYGSVGVAAELAGEHQALAEAAEAACELLVSTFEMDLDNVYGIAHAYKKADEAAATLINKARVGAP